MEPSAARLILLPGMGADQRLFAAQRALFPNLLVPLWLAPRPAETLASYGERMAATIDLEPPYFLGGASLGGMVALEMARHLAPKAVFLIGSCRSGRAVPLYLRALEVLSLAVPDRAIEASWRFAHIVLLLSHRLTDEQRRLVVEMLRATPTAFLRWAGHALLGWDFAATLPCPVHHIHGDRDCIIPLRRVQADRVVPGGPHLLTLTDADAVNAFLLEHIAEARRP